MQDLGARAREMSAGVVRALERMSVDPVPGAAASSPPPGTIHPPDDHPLPPSSGSGLDGGSPTRTNSGRILPTATLTPTPEHRSGTER